MYVNVFLRTVPDSVSPQRMLAIISTVCFVRVRTCVGVHRGDVNDEVFTKLLALM